VDAKDAAAIRWPREHLADLLRAVADSYRRRVEEHGNAEDAASVVAVEALRDYVSSLPEHDPRLDKLARYPASVVAEALRKAERWTREELGLGRPDLDPAPFRDPFDVEMFLDDLVLRASGFDEDKLMGKVPAAKAVGFGPPREEKAWQELLRRFLAWLVSWGPSF
jgi:hypothetical protein